MPKSSKFKPSKPENFTDSEWESLTPIQQARYSTNPQLFKPGESGKRRVHRSGASLGKKNPVGRPRKDGLPPISKGQREVILGNIAPPSPVPEAITPSGDVQKPSFEVIEAQSVREALETNGLAFLNDAYARASRAHTSGDPFDKAVYLTLLGKAHPMATITGEKSIPGSAKKHMRLLTKLLAEQDVQDGEFRTVEG